MEVYSCNKTAYCLLAFFLGWIGIHKFYCGMVGRGVVYLVLFWTGVPACIAFVEFIIGLTKRVRDNGLIYFPETYDEKQTQS